VVDQRDTPSQFERPLPLHGLDDLADDLRQPTQGMGFGKLEQIGGRRQEVAAFIDQRLQMKFDCLTVQQDDRAPIPRRLGLWFEGQVGEEAIRHSLISLESLNPA
jgi:hypothetical protein